MDDFTGDNVGGEDSKVTNESECDDDNHDKDNTNSVYKDQVDNTEVGKDIEEDAVEDCSLCRGPSDKLTEKM